MSLKRKLYIACVLTVIVFCVSGCEQVYRSVGTSGQGEIKIKDIVWEIDEGIIDGNRSVLFACTNNSSYTIAGLELSFKEKAGVEQEEKDKFYADIQKDFSFEDEEIELVKEKEISMHTYTERIISPGESIKNVRCYYFDGYYYLKNIEHYDLVEPDIIKIKYIKDDQIYTTYYDFSSDKYSTEDKTELAFQWSDKEIGNKIPKPDKEVVQVMYDSDDTFLLYVYGVEREEFDNYVDECKDLGYVVDTGGVDDLYYADNREGYSIRVSYDQEEHCMSVNVDSESE